jgi:hypothetical protein
MTDTDCTTTVVFWGPNASDGDIWVTTVPKDSTTITGAVTFDWNGTAYQVPLSSIKYIKPSTTPPAAA